jgi:hypothetical protein
MNVLYQERPRWVFLLKNKTPYMSIMLIMDRETMLTVGTIICALAVIFLFREMNKTKQDIDNFKNFSEHLVRQLNAPATRPRGPEKNLERKVKSEE